MNRLEESGQRLIKELEAEEFTADMFSQPALVDYGGKSPKEVFAHAEEQVNQARSKLRSLGPVNIDALEEYQEILEFIDLPLLKTLKSYELSKWPQSFKLLLDGPLLKKKDEIIGIISVGNLSNSIISQIKNTLDSNQNNDSVEVVDSLYDLKKYDKKLIVFGSGFLTKDQLFSFKEEYDLCNFVFEGALFLEA